MKLYGYWRSSASWRVRIALAWKGVPHTYVPVHLVRDGGEQNQDAFRAKNPMGQIPCLELDDGTTIGQSLAILEYLEERYPEPALLPMDLLQRARIRQLSEMVNSGIQPLQNLSVMQTLQERKADDGWARHWIERGLAAFEIELETSAGRYCVGDEVSFADLCLIPQLYSARRFGVDVSKYPRIAKIETACAELPAFQVAHADAQPDAAA